MQRLRPLRTSQPRNHDSLRHVMPATSPSDVLLSRHNLQHEHAPGASRQTRYCIDQPSCWTVWCYQFQQTSMTTSNVSHNLQHEHGPWASRQTRYCTDQPSCWTVWRHQFQQTSMTASNVSQCLLLAVSGNYMRYSSSQLHSPHTFNSCTTPSEAHQYAMMALIRSAGSSAPCILQQEG